MILHYIIYAISKEKPIFTLFVFVLTNRFDLFLPFFPFLRNGRCAKNPVLELGRYLLFYFFPSFDFDLGGSIFLQPLSFLFFSSLSQIFCCFVLFQKSLKLFEKKIVYRKRKKIPSIFFLILFAQRNCHLAIVYLHME